MAKSPMAAILPVGVGMSSVMLPYDKFPTVRSVTGGFHGSAYTSHYRSRGLRLRCRVAHGWHGGRPGSAPKPAWQIRLLRALALLGPILLRCGLRAGAGSRAAAGMPATGLSVRGSRPVAAIRNGVSGILPAAGAAT